VAEDTAMQSRCRRPGALLSRQDTGASSTFYRKLMHMNKDRALRREIGEWQGSTATADGNPQAPSQVLSEECPRSARNR
jgi:hypothetical protein